MVAPLEPGSPAPDFEGRTQDGAEVRLRDLRGRPVVLYFYPADMTTGCTMEACAFRDEQDKFQALDAVVLGVTMPRHIHFLVMPRVFHASPLHPPFHRWLGSIPVNLERPDSGAIKRALRVVEDGGVVGIFPEGPFSREGRLVPGQPGVAMMALRSGVPVVPAAISGTYEALAGRRFYIPRSHPLAVRFGQPLHFHQTRRRRATHANREEITRRIMSQIAALLEADGPPAAQRGEAGAS